MDELDKIRQPRPLNSFQLEEVKLTFPFIFLSISFPFKKQRIKKKSEVINQEIRAEDYLEKVRNIEPKLNSLPIDEEAHSDLRSIADDLNLKVAVLNNAFIHALYPASSINDLVRNMASKIYYQDLREEAEMHHSVILKLSNKIRDFMSKFNIDKSEDERCQGSKGIITDIDAVKLLLDLHYRNQNEYSEDILLNLVKSIDFNRSLISQKCQDEEGEEIKEIDFNNIGKRVYILSDEAQAAVGIMIDIEKRKIIVESLVQEDRRRSNQTTTVITVVILLVIFFMILGGFMYGPQFTVCQQKLDDLNLPLINIPWPVIFWSFLGSFAAMIYRFNRQPIHEFGNVLKWTVTRLVQGVILGSAFYLILISGISLLSGVSTENTVEVENSRIATEVVLLLTFLVGFSDRFADSIFNALIDKYSIKTENEDTKQKTHNTL